jgi:hypothetical protein
MSSTCTGHTRRAGPGRDLVEPRSRLIGRCRCAVLLRARAFADLIGEAGGRQVGLGGVMMGDGGPGVGLEAALLGLDRSQQGVFDVCCRDGLAGAQAVESLRKRLAAHLHLARPGLGALVKTVRVGHAQE